MKKELLFLLLIQLWAAALMAQHKDSIVTLPEVIVTSTLKINEQIDRSFAHKFPDAYDIVWKKMNKDYLTKFIQVDVKHQALFSKNGVLKYDIIYMGESHIPKRIADLVSNSYDSYNITNAARVDRAGQIFWIINLEGLSSYKVIRIDEDAEMEEVRHFNKNSE